MGRLTDKVAVITGGGSGIGFETSLEIARQGAKVVVVDLNLAAAEKTAEAIRAKGGDAIAVAADVSKDGDCAGMIAAAEKKFGKVNVLFNNAGISHADDNTAEDTSLDVYELTMNVNVKGVLLGCRHGIPAIRRAGGGSIINTASFVAHVGAATAQICYTASKGAVLSMTRELATIHARENIRVNALCPGPLNTELLQKYMNTDAKRGRRLVHIPMGRFGEPHEIAKATVFLASDESSYVTGTSFMVDGGITAAYVTPE
ncbi:MAG: glucose 1-dehydrogenase [archaeon]|nr:glucose 1-dehydrogenase [archaeon]